MNLYENKNNIQFDTIKIRTKIKYLKKYHVKFNDQYNPTTGRPTGCYYSSKHDNNIPFNLCVWISHIKQSMSIEFSSKILLDDYPKLITKDTFKQCLENINTLGICELDVEAIAEDCYLSKAHFTKDISLTLDDTTLDTLNTQVNNYRRYKWKHYEGTGIDFTRDVTSKDCKETITIYNKEIEIKLSENREFLSMLKNPEKILQYFNGMGRFEVKANTVPKIMEYLNFANTDSLHILNVFSSTANPVLYQFNKIFDPDTVVPIFNINTAYDYHIKNTILLYNYDLKRIHQDLKMSFRSRSGLAKNMKKVEAMCISMQNTNNSNNGATIIMDIRNKLQN